MSSFSPAAHARGLAALTLGLLAASVAVAGAQGTSQPVRPSPGVFGGAGQAPHDTVVATVSAYGAQDGQLSGEPGASNAQTAPIGAFYSGTDIGISYVPSERGKVTYDLRGTSGLRYYPSLSDWAAATQSLSAGASWLVNQQSTFHVRGGASYFPYFDFSQPVGLTDGAPAAPQRLPNNQLSTRRVVGYETGFDYTYQPNRRTALTLLYGLRRTELLDEAQTSLDTTVSAAYSRRLSRASSARVTYAFRDGGYRFGTVENPLRVNDIEFGFDRDWAQSQTRRTSLSLSAGPSIVDYQGQRGYRAFGAVTLSRPFGRSWNMRALYRRGVTFLDGTSQPFLSNTATFGIGGLLTRRLDLSLSAGAVLGDIGFEAGAGTAYDTYTGSARMRYGLTNTFACYAEYLYSYSKYGSTGPVADLNRRGFRVGLTVYAPLLQQGGRTAGRTQ